MKTKDNNSRIFLRLIAVLLFLAGSTSVSCQERIRGSESYLLCDTSIIRCKNYDTVMMYNKHYTSTFMMLSNGMPAGHTWYIEPCYINDFKIVNNKTVFFCGYILEQGVKKAIFGRFPLASFLTDSSFHFSVLDTCTELRKLDYYKIDEGMMSGQREERVVMTGSTKGGRSDVLVDWVVFTTLPPSPYPPYPNVCDIYYSSDTTECFDDIAVTDNYVVFSSRHKKNGISQMDFWQFDRPTAVGYSIFYQLITHLQVGSPAPETPVLIEHSEGDNYAAVYKQLGYSRMTILQLAAPNGGVNSVDIPGDNLQTIIPIEIKYNKSSQVFDILARSNNYRDDSVRQYIPMQIYHVTQNVINGLAVTGDITRYIDNLIWSIDPSNVSIWYVASGDQAGFPRLFWYRHDNWDRCTTSNKYICEHGKPEKNLTNNKVVGNMYLLEIISRDARKTIDIEYPELCPIYQAY